MTGYILLFLTVLLGVSKGYCGKKTSEYINGVTDGLILQSIRLVLCVIIGGCLFAFSNSSSQIDGTILLISLFNGIANATFLLTWLFAIKSGAYLFVDICLTAGGIIIPCVCGQLFFDGKITILQYIGIVIMLIAVLVMNSYNATVTRRKISLGNVLLLVCVAVSNGLTCVFEKFFAYYTARAKLDCDVSLFSLMTFAFAAIVLFIALIIVNKCNKQTFTQSFKSFPFNKLWIYLILISSFLFFNIYLTTLANSYITNTVLVYPLKFGSNLVLSAIMAAVLFKEKPNIRSVLGMILITVSIIFINVI